MRTTPEQTRNNPKTGNDRHRVTLGIHAKPSRGYGKGELREGVKRGKGGRLDLYAFSWADFAKLFGCTPREAQILSLPKYQYVYDDGVNRGKGTRKLKEKVLVREALFDPRDLQSIFEYLKKRDPAEELAEFE